jgi:hypothetical protein
VPPSKSGRDAATFRRCALIRQGRQVWPQRTYVKPMDSPFLPVVPNLRSDQYRRLMSGSGAPKDSFPRINAYT